MPQMTPPPPPQQVPLQELQTEVAAASLHVAPIL